MLRKYVICVVLTALLVSVAGCGSEPAPREEAPEVRKDVAPAAGSATKAEPAAAAAPVVSTAAPGDFEVRYGAEGTSVKVGHDGNVWTATEGGTAYSVKKDGNGYTLVAGDETVATGRLEVGKLELQNADGGFYAELKFKDDKIKIALVKDTETPWELKCKPEKVKLVKNEQEFGGAKYYPDTGKIKVKDAQESTVAEGRDMPGLCAGPAVFLVPDFDVKQRNLFMLLLFALGK